MFYDTLKTKHNRWLFIKITVNTVLRRKWIYSYAYIFKEKNIKSIS